MPTEGEKSPEAENNNNNNKKGKTGGSQVKHAYPNRDVPKLLAFKMKCSANSISFSGHLSLGWMKRLVGCNIFTAWTFFLLHFAGISCFPCNRSTLNFFLFILEGKKKRPD